MNEAIERGAGKRMEALAKSRRICRSGSINCPMTLKRHFQEAVSVVSSLDPAPEHLEIRPVAARPRLSS